MYALSDVKMKLSVFITLSRHQFLMEKLPKSFFKLFETRNALLLSVVKALCYPTPGATPVSLCLALRESSLHILPDAQLC